MMRLGLLAICAIYFAFGCVAEIRAETRQVASTSIGRWTLLAFAGDPDEYASCSIATVNQDGVQFGVWTDTLGGWRILLGADEWQLEEGTEYDVRYAIDNEAPTHAKALAVVGNSVHISLGRDFPSTDLLRKGNRISIQTAQQTFSFDLAGSARALDAMRDCARRWLGHRGASTDPFSEDSRSSQNSSPPSDPDIPRRMSGSRNEFFEPVRVGPWSIGANSGLMNHAFTSCTATPPDTGDYAVVIRLDRRRDWNMQVLNSAWELKPGIPIEIRYSIDGGPAIAAQGEVLAPQVTNLVLGKKSALIDALRRGQRLRFQLNGEDFSFDLSGASRALDATIKCVEHYAAEG